MADPGTQYIKKLARQRKWLLTGYGAVVSLYIAGIGLWFYNMKLCLLWVSTSTFIYIFILRRFDQAYNRNFAIANIKMCCQKQLQRITVEKRGSSCQGCLSELMFFPFRKRGGVASGLTIKGKDGDSQVRISDIAVCFDREKDGHKKTGVLSGILFLKEKTVKNALCSEAEASRIIVWPKAAEAAGILPGFYTEQGMKERELPKKKLQEQFRLYTDPQIGQEEAGKVLRAYETHLLRIPQKPESFFVFCFTEQKTAVFWEGKSLCTSVPLRERVTEDIARWNRIPELTEFL